MADDPCAKTTVSVPDADVFVAAMRTACEALRLDLSREQEEFEVIDEEFRQSLSYRIGSVLCPNSRL